MAMLRRPVPGFCLLCGQLLPGWDRAVTRARAILSAAMSDTPDLPPVDDPLEPVDPDLPADPDDPDAV